MRESECLCASIYKRQSVASWKRFLARVAALFEVRIICSWRIHFKQSDMVYGIILFFEMTGFFLIHFFRPSGFTFQTFFGQANPILKVFINFPMTKTSA